MLSDWLSRGPTAMDLGRFTHQHFGQAPFAAPGTARSVVPLLGWNTLGRVLAAAAPEDVLVVARGRLLAQPPPRSLPEARAVLAEGTGLVVRRAALYDPLLATAADRFSHDLPGRINLHLFVTPPNTHGFGWHYDTEHVFIVQTAGRKDYYFRANSSVAGLPADHPPDLSRYPTERSPMMSATLEPGDWLYLPARWWHVALAAETSLSLSIGVWPTVTAAAAGSHARLERRPGERRP